MTKRIRCNLHTHTTLSDGALAPEALVQEAVAAGLTHLAITDHLETAKLLPQHAVKGSDLGDYARGLRRLAEANRSRITLYVGIEIDFARGHTDLGAMLAGGPEGVPWELFDFVLFEYVNDRGVKGRPLGDLIEMRPLFPCAVGLAHNDLSRNFHRQGPEQVAHLLRNADIFLELNAAYGRVPIAEPHRPGGDRASSRPVPWFMDEGPFAARFFQLARETGVEISIANDTHGDVPWGSVSDVDWALDELMDFVRAHGLEDNLIIQRLDAGRAFMPRPEG